MHHLIVGEHQNKVLAVRIQHTESQFPIVMAPEERVIFHISQEIIHPAHVPLIIKSHGAVVHISGNLGPCRRLLRNQNRSRLSLLKHGIQMFQEFHCFQILISAVDIGDPLAIVLAVIQIQHGSHRVHADAIRMILPGPEQRVGNQEVGHLGTSIIVNQSPPVRMHPLPWVLVLIDTGHVKACKS